MNKIIAIKKVENSFKVWENNIDGEIDRDPILFVVVYENTEQKQKTLNYDLITASRVIENCGDMVGDFSHHSASCPEMEIHTYSDERGAVGVRWLKEIIIEGAMKPMFNQKQAEAHMKREALTNR